MKYIKICFQICDKFIETCMHKHTHNGNFDLNVSVYVIKSGAYKWQHLNDFSTNYTNPNLFSTNSNTLAYNCTYSHLISCQNTYGCLYPTWKCKRKVYEKEFAHYTCRMNRCCGYSCHLTFTFLTMKLTYMMIITGLFQNVNSLLYCNC